jgi:hypothetical protein
VAVASGIFVIGGVSGLLHDVRDWLSAVLKRMNDVCDLLNVRDRLNDVAVTGTVAVCGRELAVGGGGIGALPGHFGVCSSRIAGITGVNGTAREE